MQLCLNDAFPELQEVPATQFSFSFGHGVARQETTKQMQFRFTGNDDGFDLIVTPSTAALLVPGERYAGREAFENVLADVVGALLENGVRLVEHFAVRYVNLSSLDEGWEDRWRPEFLGWVMNPNVVGARKNALTQAVIESGQAALQSGASVTANAVVRYGPVAGIGQEIAQGLEQTPRFVLDCELQSIEKSSLEVGRIRELFRAFDHEAAGLLHFALTDVGRAYFGLRYVE